MNIFSDASSSYYFSVYFLKYKDTIYKTTVNYQAQEINFDAVLLSKPLIPFKFHWLSQECPL